MKLWRTGKLKSNCATTLWLGASSGADCATALEFSKYETNLMSADRNEAELCQVKAECEELGAQVLVVPTDTTTTIALANAVVDWQERIDVWINNANLLAAGDFDKAPMAHKQVIETNLLGYMNGAQALLPFFKEQQGAHSLIISLLAVFYLFNHA